MKKTLVASEQMRPDVRLLREEWIKGRQPLMRRQAHRLVFLHETGTNTKMRPLSQRAARLMLREPSDPEGALRQLEGLIDRFRSITIGIKFIQ